LSYKGDAGSFCGAAGWELRVKIDERLFYRAAFETYPDLLKELVAGYPDAKILELGGGRDPSFALSDMPGNVATYTVNDISPSELALAGPEYDTACFDVIGDVSAFAGKYDVVFSRTLAEHVRDGRKLHENVCKLLRPGGVALHMLPTLYAAPFVINRLLPEQLSRKILLALFPRRRTAEPKFPAYYSWCYGNRRKMERMLREAGFSKVDIRTFYGTSYFRAIPGIRELEHLLSAVAAKRDWSWYGSFAHVVAHK
jgi:SAM-dependent methyltransferase